MAEWTKEELEAEHRRRQNHGSVQDARKPDARCIHCGRPFSTATAAAGAHGLCDDCLDAD